MIVDNVHRSYIAPQNAYIAKGDTHTSAYSDVRDGSRVHRKAIGGHRTFGSEAAAAEPCSIFAKTAAA